MRTNQKIRTSFILLLMILSFNNLVAQNFSAKDINHVWTRDDGMKISILGTGIFAEGGNAIVMAVGKSGWPTNTQNYAYKFRAIFYVRDNTWKAVNYRHRVETGARIEDGEVIFVMSDDKKSMKILGGYNTYTRD